MDCWYLASLPDRANLGKLFLDMAHPITSPVVYFFAGQPSEEDFSMMHSGVGKVERGEQRASRDFRVSYVVDDTGALRKRKVFGLTLDV